MLKQRLITGFVLGGLIAWSIVYLPSSAFAVLIAILIVLGVWEWTYFIRLDKVWHKILYLVSVVGIMFALWHVIVFYPQFINVLIIVALLWWLTACIWMLRFSNLLPSNLLRSNLLHFNLLNRGGQQSTILKLMVGVIVLVPAWAALVSMHSSKIIGPNYVLFFLFLVAIADSCAYFTGRRWGKTKLAPQISPGKTWEGVAGALLSAFFITIVGGFLLGLERKNWVVFIPLCLLTVLFSIIGDLLESMFKRQAGLKDSSKLLPGHGGVLDRIDSATAAAPAFFAGLIILGIPY